MCSVLIIFLSLFYSLHRIRTDLLLQLALECCDVEIFILAVSLQLLQLFIHFHLRLTRIQAK